MEREIKDWSIKEKILSGIRELEQVEKTPTIPSIASFIGMKERDVLEEIFSLSNDNIINWSDSKYGLSTNTVISLKL